MTTALQVALPVPLRRSFDYLPPASLDRDAASRLKPGVRLQVPFGNRKLTGVLLGHGDSRLDSARIRAAEAVLDAVPVIDTDLLALAAWAAEYYHHPIGEVIAALLPAALRRGQPERAATVEFFAITASGRQQLDAGLGRAKRQAAVLQRLADAGRPLTREQLRTTLADSREVLATLLAKAHVEQHHALPVRTHAVAAEPTGPNLNADQRAAVAAVNQRVNDFATHLLYGVTGSGKTEVYVHVIDKQLANNKQVLVLVPEIGLTPQIVLRLEQRLGIDVDVLHSGVSDAQRFQTWTQARAGAAKLIVGTRSAVYTPMPHLGLIIIDEEHDAAYKQQDGFRYHARAVALKRAQMQGIPVVLGSATPSLETLENVARGKFDRLRLHARAGNAKPPDVHVIDTRRSPLIEGVSRRLFDAINDRLIKQEQSLIFINRRGFAPVLVCGHCGWQAKCERCDASLCLHTPPKRLLCHHCGVARPVPEVCGDCAGDVYPVGDGTQRIESHLGNAFPEARLLRLDRDSVSSRNKLDLALTAIRERRIDIIVGTQMVTKGHDFPGITLVGVINVDNGLFSHDFRATEHLVQQIMQVTGRAGRNAGASDVLLQTAHPEHACFTLLKRHDYDSFAETALAERRKARFPPFAHFALLRAQSRADHEAMRFLSFVQRRGQRLLTAVPRRGLRLMDPVPSPMEKRAGRYRAQLLVAADSRAALHGFLTSWLPQFEDHRHARRVQWSLDVDPMDLY